MVLFVGGGGGGGVMIFVLRENDLIVTNKNYVMFFNNWSAYDKRPTFFAQPVT